MQTFILLFISLTIFKLHAIPTYQELNKFPIYENTTFKFKVTETMMFKKWTVLLLVVEYSKTSEQRTSLLPGLNISDHIRLGKYFNALEYSVDGKVLLVKLKFNMKCRSCNLYIFYQNTDKKSDNQKLRNIVNIDQKFLLKKLKVSLRLHWKIELYVKTLDNRTDGLHANAIGFIVCEASGGYPHASPTILGINQLINYKTGNANAKKSKYTFEFKVHIRDFNKKIVCKCGKDDKKINLGVFHHVTKVYSDPSLKDGWLANGAKVRCLPMNGYPLPKTNWKVIKAPFKGAAEKYVVIQDDVLYLMRTSPYSSEWTFRCSANNAIPDSINKIAFQDFKVIVRVPVKPFKTIYIILIVVCFLVIFGCVFIKYLHNRCRNSPRNLSHETPDIADRTKINKKKSKSKVHRPAEAIDDNKKNMLIVSKGSMPIAKKKSKESIPFAKKKSKESIPFANIESNESMPIANKESKESMPIANKESNESMPIANKESNESMPMANKKSMLIANKKSMLIANKESNESMPIAKKKSMLIANKKSKESMLISKKKKKESMPIANNESKESMHIADNESNESMPIANNENKESMLISKKKKKESMHIANNESKESMPIAKKKSMLVAKKKTNKSRSYIDEV